jgi:phospholipase/lecithinase/hemolysin
MKTFLVAALVIHLSGWAASASPIRSIVAYGDSYSDNGNLGRESNGPVIVEDLAADLGVPLIDHAWVGATTGVGNLSDNGGLYTLGSRGYPGMTTTVNQDLAHPFPDLSGTLFVVWGGHNDILVNGQDQGVVNILNIVRKLQAAGAEHILVPGVMDLGLTPFANSQSSANRQRLSDISNTFNSSLQSALPSGVIYFDTAGILRNIIANPAAYNLTNVTAGCSLTPVCSNPDQYLFWDFFHPTARMNTIFAADIAQAVQAVPEPSVSVLTGVGVILLMIMVRTVVKGS